MNPQIKSDLERFRDEERRHAQAREQLQFWSTREQQHRMRLSSLLTLIVTQAAENGESLPEDLYKSAVAIGLSVPLLPPKITSTATGPLQIESPDDLPTNNKTEFVRRIVKQAGTTGATPADIRKAAAARQLKVPQNFPYTILFKLRQANEVKEEQGKYFPVLVEGAG